MDLSVVVATHADPLGLYMTVFSVLQQLQKSSIKWEIVIAADGGTDYKWEKLPNTRCLRIRTGSPQGTRDAGIRAAQAASVLCIESHIIVSDIESLYEAHKALNGAMTFPARIGEGPEMFSVYGSTTNWDSNLWYGHHLYAPQNGNQPYRVAQFGHSCFVIDRNWYIQSGGYTNLQTGWGGEEQFLCLKAWMLGRECWMVPQIWHAHYLTPNAHGDSLGSERMERNFAIGKYVLTGKISPGLAVTPEMIQERQRIMSGPFGGDLNKLRDYFKKEGISS